MFAYLQNIYQRTFLRGATLLIAWSICAAAAPILTSSGSASVYYRCSGDCDEYELLGEETGTGPSYDLTITRGDHVQSATGTLTVAMGDVMGSIRGNANGNCIYHGADDICFVANSDFEGAIEGQFVVTGGSGTALLRPGQFLRAGDLGTPDCAMTVNGVSGGCEDSYLLTFGVPFDLKVNLGGHIYSDGLPTEFSFNYQLDYARDTASARNYAMSAYTASAVPEPSTLFLVAAGFLVAAVSRRMSKS